MTARSPWRPEPLRVPRPARDPEGSRRRLGRSDPGPSLPRRVIAPADADADWILKRLDLLATKLGYAVALGRLASPVESS